MVKFLILLNLLPWVLGEILLPSTQNNPYLGGFLDNGLEYLIIQCEKCESAGVSLSVKAGSKYNTILGLAHLLEHMIFYCSKTYTQENYLQEFISLNSGYTNAYTDYEYTNYFYSIDNRALEESLKIFSKAFIEPIFNDFAVQREIHAVDSEHMKNKYNDMWREYRAMQLASDGNQYSKFTTGNLQTFKMQNLTSKVQEFFDSYYIAENMKLVIYANYKLDVLEDWVSKLFSDLRRGVSKSMPPEKFMKKSKILYMGKVSEGIELQIMYEIPSETLSPLRQPGDFIAYLLNNQGPKGFLGLFPTVQSFQANIVETISDFSLISILFTLTTEKDHEKIIGSLPAAIEKILSLDEDYLGNIWQDYFYINYYNFYYADKLQPEKLASKISANMLYLPTEFYYSGFDLKTQYSYSDIQNTLRGILESPILAILASSNFMPGTVLKSGELKLDDYCEIYDLYYEIKELNVQRAQNIEFETYSLNPIMPNHVAVVSGEEDKAQIVFQSPGLEIWYKFDESFGLPKATVVIFLFTENWEKVHVEVDLWVKQCQLMITQDLYLYKVAGYTSEIIVSDLGLRITLKGWNIRINSYTEEVIKIITSSTIKDFDKAWQWLYEDYSYFFNDQPYIQADAYLTEILHPSSLSYSSKLSHLSSLSSSSFTNPFLSKIFWAKVLCFGNQEKTLIQDLSGFLQSSLPILQTPIKKPHYKQITDFSTYNYISLDNHCILIWYDFGEFSMEKWAAVLVLTRIANDRAFRVLRTQQQLGYIVYAQANAKFSSNSFKLVIQGSEENPDFFEEAIEKFWVDFEIDQELIENTIEKIGQSLLWPYESLDNLFFDTWKEIYLDRYTFGFNELLAPYVQNIKTSEISEMIKAIKEKKSQVEIKIYKQASEILMTNL